MKTRKLQAQQDATTKKIKIEVELPEQFVRFIDFAGAGWNMTREEMIEHYLAQEIRAHLGMGLDELFDGHDALMSLLNEVL